MLFLTMDKEKNSLLTVSFSEQAPCPCRASIKIRRSTEKCTIRSSFRHFELPSAGSLPLGLAYLQRVSAIPIHLVRPYSPTSLLAHYQSKARAASLEGRGRGYSASLVGD